MTSATVRPGAAGAASAAELVAAKGGSTATAPTAKKAAAEEGNLPLAVTEKPTGRRWGLTCKMRKR